MEPNVQYLDEAHRIWNQARRKAFWDEMLANLEGVTTGLLSFEEIERRLSLKNAIYRGVQDVPLDKVVGSLGRYQDFTRAFLPTSNDMRDRWERLAMISLDPVSPGWPPIDVYKVGESYFVKDGNHRVSVARQLNAGAIEAYVWEYPVPVAGPDEAADLDTLLIEAERGDFEQQTRLSESRPGHGIRFTAPGGYPELLCQIAGYQIALGQIDGEEPSFEEAAIIWYDLLYETTVQLIEATGVLGLFAERTAADFYVWITYHREALEEQDGERVMVEDAARDFEKANRRNVLTRSWQGVLTWVSRRMAS